MMYLFLGASLGLLVASLALNGFLFYTRYDMASHWRNEAIASEDARKAAELRSAQQIDAMLDRVHTAELQLDPASPAVVIDPAERKYIADHVADDQAWNEYRGEDGD